MIYQTTRYPGYLLTGVGTTDLRSSSRPLLVEEEVSAAYNRKYCVSIVIVTHIIAGITTIDPKLSLHVCSLLFGLPVSMSP